MRQGGSLGKAVRWLCLIVLVAVLPLFIRANSAVQEDSTLAATQQLAMTPLPAQTPDPVPEPTEALTEPPTPEQAPVEPLAEGIVFADITMTEPPVNQTPAPAPTDAPTLAPGVWSYVDDRMEVHITRHEREDFVYFAADIQLTDPNQFSYAFSNERYGAHTEALSDIAERHDPLLAINGDYYSFHPNGIIIRGGELFRSAKSSRHLLIVDANGDLRVMTDRSEKQGLVADRLMEEGVLHTFEFGPVLVENGKPAALSSVIVRVGKGYLEPRTAIGQVGPLHYLIIVVDGRSEGYSEGCDLPTLQSLFVEHGVDIAFNLDGGGSTTLWFDGEVINRPSAGGERKVSDIVMFMR